MQHINVLRRRANISRPQLAIFILAFACIGYLVFKSFAASNPNLPGDLNNDNTVNAQDLSLLLSNYGTTNSAGDVNGDGTVNAIDLSILLSHYGQSVSSSVPNFATTRWYAATSAWNTPVPVPAPIHPDSSSMIQGNSDWVNGSVNGNGWLRLEREEMATHVPSGTPTVRVWIDYNESSGQYVAKDHSVQVPIPSWFWTDVVSQSYTDTDRKGTFELDNGDEYGFGKLTGPTENPYVYTRFGIGGPADGNWHAVRMDLSPYSIGKGWVSAWGYSKINNFENGELHNRATIVSNAAGMIRPRDTRDIGPSLGHYDHALAFVSPFFAAAGQTHPCMVKPASGCDGTRTGLSAIPQGARIILDPSLDVANWCATHNQDGSPGSVPADKQAWLLPILRTLQIYGMIGVDSTGVGSPPSGAIVANHTGSNQHNENYLYPWETQSYGWTYGNSIPLGLMSHFEVVDWTIWTGS